MVAQLDGHQRIHPQLPEPVRQLEGEGPIDAKHLPDHVADMSLDRRATPFLGHAIELVDQRRPGRRRNCRRGAKQEKS